MIEWQIVHMCSFSHRRLGGQRRCAIAWDNIKLSMSELSKVKTS